MVIDINSRRQRSEPVQSDEQRAQKFAEGCSDRVFVEVLKMQAINGHEAAVAMIEKIASDLKNHGRNES